MKGDNMTEVNDPSLWWKQAVVYQVYPRSFKDSRGEGLGQIAGVTEKIGYLKELGVDAIWLSPFYPSQLADGGYDVDDYRNVDPKLGTMDDFDALAKAAHADGIKIGCSLVNMCRYHWPSGTRVHAGPPKWFCQLVGGSSPFGPLPSRKM